MIQVANTAWGSAAARSRGS